MKKLERMKKLKEKLLTEDIENAKKDAADKGLGFVEHEIPPDEVDEEEVRRSLWVTLKSFIPYTNEWYESMAAEEEMDNLKKIRIERVKAEDLYTMTKMGRHEEALESMMSETNYDFFYFNKLKLKAEEEGKFKFVSPKDLNIFADFDKSGNRNRLKKAINQVNTFMDEKLTQEMTRLATVDATSKKFTNDSPCVWRGKTKSGENLKCDNSRMRKPPKKNQPPSKMKEGEDDNFYQFCCYHVPFCSSGNHESNEMVKIKQPNSEGFCSECYMLKMKKKPPSLTSEVCPGVVPLVILGGTNSKKVKQIETEGNDDDDGGKPNKKNKRKNVLQCQWAPNPENEKMRAFECMNERMIDPATNQRLPNCPWHLTRCVREHPPGTNAVISVPNIHGLCNMHYLSEYGVYPPELEFPFPGMRMRQNKDFWKNFSRHFAAPPFEPPPDILCVPYQEPGKADNVFDWLKKKQRYAIYLRNYFLYSEPAAVRIQSCFRMYRVKKLHLELKDKKTPKLRMEAAITVQTQMRRFLETRYMKEKRKLYNFSCTQIQRIFRGWSTRQELRRQWAARRIQKFMKLLHFLKFRDTVIMVMQLRRLFQHRVKTACYLQRILRGYSARLFVFNKRFYNIISRVSAKKIQRWYRFHHERRNRKPWVPPSEEWARKQCAKKLSRMILELYLNSKRRKQLLVTMNKSAPEVQRLVRGFLAKQGRKKLSFLRNALRNWMKPEFAIEFMQEFLKNRYIELYFKKRELLLKKEEEAALEAHQLFLRSFLPSEKQNNLEIDKSTFESLLDQWYDSIKLPLMSSEKNAIMKRFKNPVNGKMLLRMFDEYILHHPQPCRKHGRRICGSCYYWRNCKISGCSCHEYQKNHEGHRSGICLRCSHPMNLHAVAPLQMKMPVSYVGEKKMAMLDLLAFEPEMDLSLPVHAHGVPIETILIPQIDRDDIRSEQGRRVDILKATVRKEADFQKQTSLIHGLATGMVEGDTVYDKNQYWKQYSTSSVEPHKVFRPSSLTGDADDDDASYSSVTKMDLENTVYEKVTFNECDIDLSNINYQTVWEIIPQNPNKTVTDYNEKFDHNIPVPVITHGELVYSFEGPKIYYNIINQLITMEEYIHYDNPIFLKLVMDHIQIFERHWRKMVVDIRTGKLDRRLPISEESRMIFESSNIPRPVIAEKLDKTFRDLGFHKKVLGKDIVIRPYAEKKKNMDRAISPPKRKRSLPFVPSEEGVLSMSRLPTRGNTTDFPRMMSSPPKTASFAGNLHRNRAINTANTTGALATSPQRSFSPDRGTRLNTATSARPNSATGPSKRELLRTLGETFKERKHLLDAIENNPQKPLTSLTQAMQQFNASPPKRRKSHSEAQRPATQAEVRSANYELVTAPRDKQHYREIMSLNEDRYVCPFPACGVTFLSKDAAIRHMVTHEQKTRLSAATPQSDSHLRFYWPKDVPWLTTKTYTEKKLPPGSIRCTHPGCPEIFATSLKLEAHLRLVHLRLHPSALKLGYFAPSEKMLKAIPPDRPIEGFNLQYCQFHAVPTGKCATCMEIENNSGPKPPYQIYDFFTFDLVAKDEAMSVSGANSSTKVKRSYSPSKKNDLKFVFHTFDRQYGLVLHDNTGRNEEIRGRVIYLVVDRNRVGWLGLERLFTMNELMMNGLVAFDFQQSANVSRYELFSQRSIDASSTANSPMATSPTGSVTSLQMKHTRLPNNVLQWFPIHTVQRVFPVHYITKSDVNPDGDHPKSVPLGHHFMVE